MEGARKASPLLRGRHVECAQVEDLLNQARAGRSGVMVVRGDAGIGKTALLDYAVGAAHDFQVARASGVQSEMELPFAALHQLCGRFMGMAEALPSPQATTLRVAFGVDEGDSPRRFLIGLGVLSLLSAVAEKKPLLCVIDDAQWLDQASAQALSFVGRRLEADAVVLLFAMRDASPSHGLESLPVLTLAGLSDDDASVLLTSKIQGRLDDQVRNRIIAEAHGNPLALLELPAAFTEEALAGGFGLSGSVSLTARMEEIFLHRAAVLPIATQAVLQVAAADPTGDVDLLQRAVATLGGSLEEAKPAEVEGLIDIGSVVSFRHPLVRSAIYQAASVTDRRRAHRALAESTDPEVDPDRRAWHRAHSSSEANETVAAELETSAARAQGRGGLAAAAAFLEKATALTPDSARRAHRALAAAKAKMAAGSPEAGRELLEIAAKGPLGDVDQAVLERMRAELTYFSKRSRVGARMLLEAAGRIKNLDAGLARETYLEAFEASALSGRMGTTAREVVERARNAPPANDPPRPLDLLLDGYVARLEVGYEAGVPALKQAIASFRDETHFRWLWLASIAAIDLWDDDSWFELATRQVQLCRDAGALTVLPYALNSLASFSLIAGDLAAAHAQIQQADAISEATGNTPLMYAALWVACWRGVEEPAYLMIEACTRNAEVSGDSVVIPLVEYAEALLFNGLGRYETAASVAQGAFGDEVDFSKWMLLVSPLCPELIEACARSGREDLARGALGWLSERTQASGTDWGLGVEARCRALLTEGPEAEHLYREAIERLARSRMRTDLGRAHLLYGEWLRRQRRRTDAREQLTVALEMFTSMEATGFARRAERELGVTAASARTRSPETRFHLTAQESRIARLASEGMTNPQIASELFISARTVEYHLHKVFTKLGVDSRHRLAKALVETIPVGAGR